MKKLSKNQKIGLGLVALVAGYFAWQKFKAPKAVVVSEEVIEEVE